MGGAEGLHLGIQEAGASGFWNSLRIDSGGLAFIDANQVHVAFGGTAGGTGDFRVAFAETKGDVSTQPQLTDRLVINETGFWLYDSDGLNRTFISEGTTQQIYAGGLGGTGTFTVFEWDPNSDLTAARLIMGAEGVVTFYRSPGSDFSVQERAAGGGSIATRFRITDTHNWFQWPATASRLLIMPPVDDITSRPDISGRVQMVNHYGFGALMRYLSTSTGGSARVDFTDAGGGTYVNITAGAYTNGSSEKTKTDIQPFAGDPAAILGAADVVTFRRKGPVDTRGKSGKPGRLEHGFIAEQVPPEIVVLDSDDSTPIGVDITTMLALAIAWLQRMEKRLTDLEGARP